MEQGSWRELFAASRLIRLGLVCLGIWLNAADSLVTATIMPSVARDIGGYAYFAWPVATYLLGAILGGASAGRLSHRYGLHASLCLSAAVYALGCVGGALAPTMGVFIAGRLFQGMGAGLIVGACYVAINMMFPADLWRRVLASLAGVWGIATLLGPLLGGLFAQGGAWRALFWMFAAQALVFAIAAWTLVPRAISDEADTPVPVRTLTLLGAAIVCIMLAGVSGALAFSLPLALGGIVLLGAAFRGDRSSAARLFPRHVTDLRSTAGLCYVAIFAFCIASIGFGVYGAAILQALYGLSPLVAGYVIGAEAMGWTVAALFVGELSQRHDRLCMRLGAALILAGIAALAYALPSGSLVLVILSATVLGVGFGTSWAYFARHILQNLDEKERSVGASAIPVSQMIGNAVGAAAAGILANVLGAGQGITPQNAALIGAWLFVAATPVAAAGFVCAWRATPQPVASGT